MFQTKFVEKIKTRILCSVAFFLPCKSRRLWDIVEKKWQAGQATDDNMVQVLCILDTQDYKHILRICNTY
jgi:hypothetical protein